MQSTEPADGSSKTPNLSTSSCTSKPANARTVQVCIFSFKLAIFTLPEYFICVV